jgi:hypothetical protein
MDPFVDQFALYWAIVEGQPVSYSLTWDIAP